MKNIKVVDKNTGEEKNVKLDSSKKSKKEYSTSMKVILLIIVLMLVVPTIITAISYLVGN